MREVVAAKIVEIAHQVAQSEGLELVEVGVRLVHRGAKLIATNLDPSCPTADGLRPGCGALVAMLETATGVKAFSVGKPSPLMIREAVGGQRDLFVQLTSSYGALGLDANVSIPGVLDFSAGSASNGVRRVVWDGADPLFAKTFLFHPRDARTEVLNLVDDSLMTGASRDEIMGKLSQLYLRWHRHGHLNAGRIYKGAFTGNTAGPVVI